ncbi:MAG: hypothetical protein ACE5II_02620 [Anaerolineae bacterium]
MEEAAERADNTLFWLSFAFWGGMVATLAFSGYVSLLSSFPWYTEATTIALLSMVFHGVLLFLGLTFGLLLVGMARRPDEASTRKLTELDREFIDVLKEEANRKAAAVQGTGSGEGATKAEAFPRRLKEALLSTLPVAAVLAATSLSGVGGSSWIPRIWFALNNFLVVFCLLGLLVLLFPGLAFIFLSAYRSYMER